MLIVAACSGGTHGSSTATTTVMETVEDLTLPVYFYLLCLTFPLCLCFQWRNAWVIYCDRHRAEVAAQHPELQFQAVSKLLGEMWTKVRSRFSKLSLTFFVCKAAPYISACRAQVCAQVCACLTRGMYTWPLFFSK